MKEKIATKDAPLAIGPYTQGISVSCGKLLFISGQIPLEPKTGELVGGVAGKTDIEAQTRRVLDNIAGILKAAGVDFSHVVKTTIYLKDISHFQAVNAIYESYFKGTTYPARAIVGVANLPKGASIEIDAIAAL